MTTITFYPDDGFSGETEFTYRATNPDGAASEAVVTVNVETGEITVVDDEFQVFGLGSYVEFSLADNDSGVGQNSTYTLVSGELPSGLSLSENGLLSGVPDREYEDSVQIQVVSSVDGSVSFSNLSLKVQVTSWSGDLFKSPAYVSSPASSTDADRLNRARNTIADWEDTYSVTAQEMADIRDSMD